MENMKQIIFLFFSSMSIHLLAATSAADSLYSLYEKSERKISFLMMLKKQITPAAIQANKWEELKKDIMPILSDVEKKEALYSAYSALTKKQLTSEEEALLKKQHNYYKKLEADLRQLYSHYSIFQSIKEEKGNFGEGALTHIQDPNNKNKINQALGRIFIMEKNGSLSFGTGLLVKKNEESYVLTCKHNFKNPDGVSFYFVPNFLINPGTGYPYDIEKAFKEIEKTDNHDNYKQKYVEKYLKNMSSLIGGPILKLDINNLYNAKYNKVALTELNETGFIDSVTLSKVILTHKTLSPLENFSTLKWNEANQSSYYAAGYPLIINLDMGISLLGRFSLGGAAPLTITSSTDKISQSTKHGHLHKAPTAEGMSGGPIFTIIGTQMHIIGVVGSGAIDINQILTFD